MTGDDETEGMLIDVHGATTVRQQRSPYPLKTMKVFDYFLIDNLKESNHVRALCQHYQRRHGLIFGIKRLAPGQWRCKRVA